MVGAVAGVLGELRERGGLRGSDVANIVGVSPATVSRWGAEVSVPHPKTQLVLSDLRYVIDRLGEFYHPVEVRVWLYSKHRLLEGARAIDLIREGRAEAVLGVIESLQAAACT